LNTRNVQDSQLYKLGKSNFLKTDPIRLQRGKQNSADNKNLIAFVGAQKSKERKEALETPNKPSKTFRDTIETLSNLDCKFSTRKTQILTFDQREAN
jgi:hypothetical protein